MAFEPILAALAAASLRAEAVPTLGTILAATDPLKCGKLSGGQVSCLRDRLHTTAVDVKRPLQNATVEVAVGGRNKKADPYGSL